MTARRRALAPALAAVLATLGPRQAMAVEHACAAPLVEADAALVARFPDLLESVRAEMARPDVDTCARVDLRADALSIHVSVSLPDGRTAMRAAQRPEDVLPTLQALLLVPEAAPQVPPPAPPRPVTAAAPRRTLPRLAPVTTRQRDRSLPAPSEPGPRTLGFELSLVGGPRMGGDQLAIGLGALSFLEVHGWLFGFQGRADRYQTVLVGDPEMGLELALLAGKRLHFRSFALDFSAGPALAMKGLAFSSTETVKVSGQEPPPSPPPIPQDPATGPVPRLLLGARAGFTPRDALRSFAGVEASLGPARAEDNGNPDSARLPIFALGLVLGATVGTR